MHVLQVRAQPYPISTMQISTRCLAPYNPELINPASLSAAVAVVISVRCPSCASSQSENALSVSELLRWILPFPKRTQSPDTLVHHVTHGPWPFQGPRPVYRVCLLGCLWVEPKVCIMWLTAHDDNMITCQCGSSLVSATSSHDLKQLGVPGLATLLYLKDTSRNTQHRVWTGCIGGTSLPTARRSRPPLPTPNKGLVAVNASASVAPTNIPM
ncbi:hypothetical protein LZ32DRAFT_274156 [Colletotrichum eremochloae]|nr:hypothetical protein LZ32DRAFT_274156 [Colletotrichum eremochloae]